MTKLLRLNIIAILIPLSVQLNAQSNISFGCKIDEFYCTHICDSDSNHFNYDILDLRNQKNIIIPSWLENNEIIEEISLINCNFDSIPKKVLTFKNLSCLLFGHNNLTSLPSEICQLKNLQVINLFRNPITDLPDCLAELECLEIVMISGTEIRHLPDVLYRIPNLSFVEFGSDFKIPEEELIHFHETRPEVDMNFW